MSSSARFDAVDALIVAHDSGDYLTAAVASLASDLAPSQVVVIDTESSDGSIEHAVASHPGIITVTVANRGFAAANNEGIKRTSRPWLLLLNPDAELLPGALRPLLDCADAHPAAGIVGAKMINADGSLQANSFGRFPTLVSVLGLHAWRVVQRVRSNAALSRRDFSQPKSVDWTTGACMLVRRAAIDQVGGMDEDFFLYYEDVDWCRRMRTAGWQVLVEPTSLCVHHLGRSGGGPSPLAQQSLQRYCAKYGLRGLAAYSRLSRVVKGRLHLYVPTV